MGSEYRLYNFTTSISTSSINVKGLLFKFKSYQEELFFSLIMLDHLF